MKQRGGQEPEIIFSIFISRRGGGRGLGQFSAKKGSLSVRFLWEGGGVLSTAPDKQGMTLVCHMKKLGPYHPFHL